MQNVERSNFPWLLWVLGGGILPPGIIDRRSVSFIFLLEAGRSLGGHTPTPCSCPVTRTPVDTGLSPTTTAPPAVHRLAGQLGIRRARDLICRFGCSVPAVSPGVLCGAAVSSGISSHRPFWRLIWNDARLALRVNGLTHSHPLRRPELGARAGVRGALRPALLEHFWGPGGCHLVGSPDCMEPASMYLGFSQSARSAH